MTKRLVCTLFYCFCFFGCIESSKPKKSINHVVLLHEKVNKEISDSTLTFLKEANDIINELDLSSDSLLIDNIYLKGNYHKKNKKLDSAAYYFHRAIDLIDSTNAQEKHLDYFKSTWSNDLKLEQYSNGTSVANKFIKIFEHKKAPNDLEYAYYFLAQLNGELKNTKRELLFYDKAIKAATDSENKVMQSTIMLSKIERVFDNDRNRAFEIIDSLSIDIDNASNLSKRNFYNTYGILRYTNDQFKEAIKQYKRAVVYIKKEPEYKYYNYNMVFGYANIAEAYIELSDIKNAEVYLDSADNYLNANSESSEVIFVGNLKISLNHLKGGSINKTQDFFEDLVLKQNKAYQDKIEEEVFALTASNNKQKLLAEQKQEAEIKNLKLKSRNMLLMILAALTTLIGYFVYRQRKLKFQKQSLQMQQRLLRSQMNPHFMSNTLYAIQNTIKKDQEGSVKYLTKFSRLLRLILENSMQNYVLLEKELESLKKYMDLQLLRFPDKFSYHIELNDVDSELLTIPPMLMQPFVENCIEHGFLGIDYKGDIKLKLSYDKKYLNCIIEDNGVGFKNLNNSKRQSASSKLISDFIFKATKSKISILDKESININESGTRIKFLIPYKILEHD